MKLMKRATALLLCFLMLTNGPISAFATEGVSGNDVVACTECGATEGHNADCSQYVDPNACAECKQVDGHADTCSQYEAPVEDIAETGGPQVGDKTWIKSGSKVYKDHTNVEKNYYELWGNYEVETVDEFACNCGENAPENIAYHADSCPRKQYIKTLFENKTAEEIYAEWENYDEATQTDLLNMLKVWDSAKYEKLNKLIEEGFNNEQEAVVGDTNIVVAGVPENVSLSVGNVSENDYHNALNQYVGNDSELLFVYDITLTNPDGSEWQPVNGQSATIILDFNGMGLPDGNKLKVLHEHNSELNELGEYTIEDGKLTFTTDGFSKFYFYITYTYGEKSFTMSGGSTVYLSEILSELEIGYSVSDVNAVNFTNPDVLEITKKGSDWKLESLAPFGSEEILTITFKDGEVIDIIVKDPVIYNYAVDSDITNVPMLETIERTVKSVDDGDKAAVGKTYTVNKKQITVENVQKAGVAEKKADTHPAPDAVHMIIYATEGMAIDFIGGTDWKYEGSRPTAAGNEIWFWSWESSIKANYVIVKDGTAGQQAMFTVTTTVNGTKYYCNVVLCVVKNSQPHLLEDNLPEGYSIKNVPVTLYNYDGKAWNEYYDKNGSNYFAFSGTSMGVSSTTNAGNRGWTSSGLQANGGGSVALMGIMKDKLVDGLPVVSQGQQVDVFSENNVPGKTVFSNVDFQFVYNEETGYYSYNSALNHAQYNSEKKTLELYEQSLAPSDTPAGDSHGNAGFYPFEDIYKAYTNTGYTSMDVETWKEKLERDAFKLIPAQYSTDIVTTSSTNPASTADMHYGLQVKSDFYLPKGKKINGQEMIYEFTGDDDLWVYIDGQLVLDIGGGHTYVSGSFNLTTGKVWVEKYTQLAAADGGSYSTREQGTDLCYTDSFLTELKDDQMHTIQIFYLERHGGVSNCRMRFNLPLVPSDAVNVSKNLVNQDGEELSVTPDVDYTFTLYTAADSDDNGDATGFSAYANKDYTVTGIGAPSGTQKTDANGQFKLKDGWIASFRGIPRFTNVYVVESNPNDGYTYTQSTISVNKAAATVYQYDQNSETKVMQLNTSINFDFVNYMQTQPLTIEKQVVNGTEGLIDQNQKFTFTLDFTKDILETGEGAIKADNSVTLTDGGTFQLGHGESITIPRVPVNMTFTLKEHNPDTTNNSFDDPVFQLNNGVKQTKVWCDVDQNTNAVKEISESFDGTIGTDGNQITVTNQQRFNLTITKHGISGIDHDRDEQQSTIYTIVGKIGNTELVEMDVAICGEGSVTVCKLPVGSYTVTENTDWSWRYKPDNGATKNVNIPMNSQAEVTYTNTRTNQYWLSGDSYCENWWGGNSGKVIRKDEKD